MECDRCDICGDPSNEKYVVALHCKHSFHYECIMKSFQCVKKSHNQCPLCRQNHGLLPIVNGLPRLYRGIHYIDSYPTDYKQTRCSTIMKSGKRKGSPCDAKCMVGLDICKRHHLSELAKQKKGVN
jgi:hypothetical protein